MQKIEGNSKSVNNDMLTFWQMSSGNINVYLCDFLTFSFHNTSIIFLVEMKSMNLNTNVMCWCSKIFLVLQVSTIIDESNINLSTFVKKVNIDSK